MKRKTFNVVRRLLIESNKDYIHKSNELRLESIRVFYN
jgi:hypothetical protein